MQARVTDPNHPCYLTYRYFRLDASTGDRLQSSMLFDLSSELYRTRLFQSAFFLLAENERIIISLNFIGLSIIFSAVLTLIPSKNFEKYSIECATVISKTCFFHQEFG